MVVISDGLPRGERGQLALPNGKDKGDLTGIYSWISASSTVSSIPTLEAQRPAVPWNPPSRISPSCAGVEPRMPFLECHWFVSRLGDTFSRRRLESSSQGPPTISAAHLATPLVQHIAAKGVPGLACEDRRMGANRGALS